MRNIGRTLVGILVLAACVATAAGCAEAAKVPTEENSLLAPATVSVESGDGKNVVQWTAVPGASTYNLYWDVKEPVTVADANRLDQVVSPYTHSGLQNGAHYYYVVTAVYPSGESPESSQVSAAPRAPVLTAPESVTLLPGDRAITISWTPVAGATGYTVYWANSSGVRAGATGVSSILVEGANVHVHAGLASGLVYHYVVTASGPGGESSPSVEVSAATVTPAPTAPLNLSAVGGDGAIELAWSPAIGAVSYNVYGSTVAGLVPGPATLIANVESCNFRHTGLVNGEVHHYFVTGVGPGGEGLASAPVSATPAPDAPDVAPAAVVAVPGAQSVRLIWSPVAGATSYVVYWALMPGVIPGAAGVTAVTGLTASRVRSRRADDRGCPSLRRRGGERRGTGTAVGRGVGNPQARCSRCASPSGGGRRGRAGQPDLVRISRGLLVQPVLGDLGRGGARWARSHQGDRDHHRQP